MQRNLVLAVDKTYAQFADHCLERFFAFNDGWEPYILDVGLTPPQREHLAQFATIRKYEISPGKYPAAWARLIMFEEFCANGQFLLYLDADTWTYGSIEEVAQEYLDSKACVGMYLEEKSTMEWAFYDLSITHLYFRHFHDWVKLFTYNTGVLFAYGKKAIQLGQRSAQYFKAMPRTLPAWGEQTAMCGAIYEEKRWPVFHLHRKYNTIYKSLEDQDTVIMHYCGPEQKLLLAEYIRRYKHGIPIPTGQPLPHDWRPPWNPVTQSFG